MSSDGEGNEDGDSPANGRQDIGAAANQMSDNRVKDGEGQFMDMENDGEDLNLGNSRRSAAGNKMNSQRMQLLNQQLRVAVQGQN